MFEYGPWYFVLSSLVVAGAMYVQIITTLWSKKPLAKKASRLGGLTYLAFLVYLAIVTVGLWVVGTDNTFLMSAAMLLGLVIAVPGTMALGAYGMGFRDGLGNADTAWRGRAATEACTCKSEGQLGWRRHDDDCGFHEFIEPVDSQLYHWNYSHPDDEADKPDRWSKREQSDELGAFGKLAERVFDFAGNTVALVLFAAGTIAWFAGIEIAVGWIIREWSR